MASTPNQLILCLAHRPLAADVLSNIVDKTGSATLNKLHEMEESVREAENEAIRASPNAVSENISSDKRVKIDSPTPTIHVLVTGSPYTTQDGRTFNEWEKLWTKGEQILALVVEKIGMKNFHSIIRGGTVQLKGKLICVKPSDFSMFESKRERLEREFTYIAETILRHLVMYRAEGVDKATILYPIQSDDDGDEMDVVELINSVLKKLWTKKDGPLNGINISIETI